MSSCKVKIKVDVCGESALDKVTTLIVKDKMEIKAACEQVAKEFNKENEGATVKWSTLRQSYYRANKTDRVTCNTKKVKKLDVPIVTPKVQDDIDKLKDTCGRLRSTNEELQERLQLAEDQVKSLQVLLLEYDTTPIRKTEQEQRDEFINAHRKAKEEKAIAERAYFGVKGDGTPI